MDCLVGYGSDDENETDRYHGHYSGSSHAAGSSRRRDDDTNYDDVNMDMSEDSQAESEPELPPAEPPRPTRPQREDRRPSNDSRDRDFERRGRRESPHRPDRPDHTNRPDRFDRTDRPDRPDRRDRDQRDRRDDRYRSERDRGRHEGGSRRGLLGDKPDGRPGDKAGAAPEPCSPRRSADARDAVSPRFRDERERERGRDRDRHARREDARSGRRDRERSRSRGAAYPPPAAHASGSSERRGSPSGDYRPSSYKVNRKLEVMEKMGLQIKTPDGSMATAAQLRLAASEAPAGPGLPAYCHPGAASTSRVLDQKRKLLWSNKNKSEAEEAAKWSGTRFAQDNDGRQVSKFMRLMGIKDQAAVKPEPADKNVDPIKKQEELFQAMQAQYEVARATTHTMRGVGLGFQRSQF